jgi:hypothetical protein
MPTLLFCRGVGTVPAPNLVIITNSLVLVRDVSILSPV